MEQYLPLLLIDIDGLRHDVFRQALDEDRIPNIARLLGGPTLEKGLELPIAAPAPSITFCSQASLFTGTHPSQHGIPGNQFFDRFGRNGDGTPRHYAFDVGDTLAVDDAVKVFTHGLAANSLQAPTLYERVQERGWRSAVVGNMYANGAETWLKPSLLDIARFTKGGNLFGLSSEEYDRRLLNSLLNQLEKDGVPEIVSIHFMGLDKESHKYGPKAQMDYLVNQIDGKVGRLWDIVKRLAPDSTPTIVFFSDHGQIEVIPDDRHSLRLAFPFERELGHLFDALGLDVHDYPGEDPDCDAVVASNGGLAFVYLHNQTEHWYDLPEFERDVLRVGKAFWEAHQSGKYATEVEGALSGVLVRNSEKEGWNAPYLALTPNGELQELDTWFRQQPTGLYLDPVNRLQQITGPMAGDMVLVSNYEDGFYFGAPITGTHGGLHPEDSLGMLAYGFPEMGASEVDDAKRAIQKAIEKRAAAENGRMASVVDLMTGLNAIFDL